MKYTWQAILLNDEEKKGLILLPKCASQYVRQNKLFKDKRWRNIQPGGPPACRDYFITALIRHPLDRLVSCHSYFNTMNKDYSKGSEFRGYIHLPFETFCEQYILVREDEKLDKHCRPQHSLLLGCAHDYIRWDFDEVDRYLGITLHRMKHNASRRKEDWQEYYSDDLRKKVEKRYEKDLEIWFKQ